MNQEKRKEEYRGLLGEMYANLPQLQWKDDNLDLSNLFLDAQMDEVNRNLLIPLNSVEVTQLKEGDGDELVWKMKQINSSSALAINVFHSIHEGQSLDIEGIGSFATYELEKKLLTVTNRNTKANIDLHLENTNTHLYVESKFTEMFNKTKYEDEKIAPSYKIENNFVDKDIYQAIKPFLFQTFRYYDGIQILRHAIGIYRDVVKQPTEYMGKKVVLLNLVWELKNTNHRFPELYKIQLQALAELNQFAFLFEKEMKTVFKKHDVEFSFIYISYEDFILHKTNLYDIAPQTFHYVVKRYLFQKSEEVSKIDYLRYLSHSMPRHIVKSGFIDDLSNMEILNGVKVDDNSIISNIERSPLSILRVIVVTKCDNLSNHSLDENHTFEYVLVNSFNHYHMQSILYLGKNNIVCNEHEVNTAVWGNSTIMLEQLNCIYEKIFRLSFVL